MIQQLKVKNTTIADLRAQLKEVSGQLGVACGQNVQLRQRIAVLESALQSTENERDEFRRRAENNSRDLSSGMEMLQSPQNSLPFLESTSDDGRRRSQGSQTRTEYGVNVEPLKKTTSNSTGRQGSKKKGGKFLGDLTSVLQVKP